MKNDNNVVEEPSDAEQEDIEYENVEEGNSDPSLPEKQIGDSAADNLDGNPFRFPPGLLDEYPSDTEVKIERVLSL